MSDLTLRATQTIGTTAAEVGKQKARKVIYIKNTSTAGQTISLSFSNTEIAVAGSGIVLAPNEYVIDASSGGVNPYEAWDGFITAISSAVGGTIAIFERV